MSIRTINAVLTLFTLSLTLPSFAEPLNIPSNVPKYDPPPRGTPKEGRVGAGTRELTGNQAKYFVLAPLDHAGLTVQAQPTLLWYTQEPGQYQFELVDTTDEKVVENGLAKIATPGIQVYKFAERIEPNVIYRWSVRLLKGGVGDSMGWSSEGGIKRIEGTFPGNLSEESIFRAAEHGLWYDALDSIQRLSTKFPEDQRWSAMRDGLLQQVGLPGLASKK